VPSSSIAESSSSIKLLPSDRESVFTITVLKLLTSSILYSNYTNKATENTKIKYDKMSIVFKISFPTVTKKIESLCRDSLVYAV
jgi:hypothetical protein